MPDAARDLPHGQLEASACFRAAAALGRRRRMAREGLPKLPKLQPERFNEAGSPADQSPGTDAGWRVVMLITFTGALRCG